jgi:CRISPR system Cascade subunit CasB
MVHLVDDSANVADLAGSIYWWNERTKKDWAFAYYSTAPNDEV